MKKIRDSKLYNYLINHKKLAAICLLVFVCFIGLGVRLGFTRSNLDHSNYVFISSDNSNYDQGDPGAWILYKDANLVSETRLQINYDINSNNLLMEKDKDVLFVINNSINALDDDSCSSGGGAVYNMNMQTSISQYASNSCVIDGIGRAIDTLINGEVNNSNLVGLITYNDDYNILTGLTDNAEYLGDLLEDIEMEGYTNYSKALEGIDAFLEHYEFSNNRELKIILFIGDVSTGNTNQEELLFNQLKEKYPQIVVYALHNMLDEDQSVLEKIRRISDYQYLIRREEVIKSGPSSKANYSTNSKTKIMELNNINNEVNIQKLGTFNSSMNDIFQELIFYKEYTQFKIIDNINKDYFNFDNFEVLKMNYGSVTYSYDDNQLVWTLDRNMISGDNAYLSVELSVNDGIDKSNLHVPVSSSTQINSILDGVADENVNTTLTPYVNFKNKVYFFTENMPEGCSMEDNSTLYYSIGDLVDVSNKQISCSNYIFTGWEAFTVPFDFENLEELEERYYEYYYNNPFFNTDSSYELNVIDGKFIMTGGNVILSPTFSGVSINKDIRRPGAYLKNGENVRSTLSSLTGYSPSSIKKIIRATSLPSNFDQINNSFISERNSDLPVYAWYDSNESTIYYYTEAETIYMNKNSSAMFRGMRSLTDISGLQYFDASKVENMYDLFNYCDSLEDITPLSDWNVSNVKSFINVFYDCRKITDISPLSGWNLLSAESLNYMFYNCVLLEDFSPLSGWNVSNVNSMTGLFAFTKLADLTPIGGWNVSNVTSFTSLFSSTKISDLTPIGGWNTSKVISIANIFSNCYDIEDITPLSGWDVSNVVRMTYAFQSTKISNLSPISGWDVSKVQDMNALFNNCDYIENVDSLGGWNVSSVTSMSFVFSGCDNLSNINALSNWDVSEVTDMYAMFRDCVSINDASALNDWNVGKVRDFEHMFYNVPTHPEFSKVVGYWDNGSFYLGSPGSN